MFSMIVRYWCSHKTIYPLQIVKNKLILMLLVSTLFLTGCIEITERIDVRDDKSGTLSLSVKMFQQNLLTDLFGFGGGAEVLNEIEALAWRASLDLEENKGIHNVNLISDKRNGMIGLSFDFDHHRQLNRALYNIAGERKTIFKPAVYRIRQSSFSRRNLTSFIEMLLDGEEDSDLLSHWITLTSDINLPRPAKHVSNKNARKLNNGKRIKSSDHLSDILEESTSTRIRIRY
jgi:hypothetical protein